MKTLLITGATGLLGKGMEETLPGGWRIVGVHQRPYRVRSKAARHLSLDIRDKRAVDRLFAAHKFDAVVHAAGIASVDYVERHYAESLESNIVGTLNVTSAARRAGTYLSFISTNAVFDGRRAPYRESDPVCPVNKYGRLKVECERLVTETLERWSILRPILMYGWNHPFNRSNPATWLRDKLSRGEAVSMVDDVWENPLYNVSCARAVWSAVAKRAPGVFHLAGKDAVNRHQFALRLAAEFGLDASLISRVSSKAFPSIAPRPPDTTFDTARMRKVLGVKPLTLAEGLAAMKATMTAAG